MKNKNIISIDGPAGSGKSSVAREVAASLDSGFYYLDTGSYYRAVTFYFYAMYLFEEIKIPFSDWIKNFQYKDYFKDIQIETKFIKNETNKTFLNSKDVSSEIRLPSVTNQIKHIADILEIRNFVNSQLRELATQNKLVMDGRDIGTIVFPDAKYKFYLTASIEVRAERRKQEIESLGNEIDIEVLKKDIQARDFSDENRKIAPLKIPQDAILIDTSNLSKNVVINMILSKVLE